MVNHIGLGIQALNELRVASKKLRACGSRTNLLLQIRTGDLK